MSGAEILGLAASVIQIAELGGKLSVKIFTFTRKVKNANKTIDALSQEIAVTGAVLQQLGVTLSNDDSVRVCSQEAIDTAKKLVSDTEKVFRSFEKLLDGEEKSSNKFRKAINLRRLKFPFLESEIEEVQANLERLKSSLLVILNVLVFAEQLRNREALPILEDQRDLIRTLAAEKDANEQRYERILKAIADRPKISVNDTDDGVKSMGGSFDATSVNSATLTLVNIGDSASQHSATSVRPPVKKVIDLPVIELPEGLRHYHERIHNHSQLVQNLLTEIDCLEYKLDHNLRGRLSSEVLDVHWREWDTYRRRYGDDSFTKILAGSSEVARHWADKVFDDQQRPIPIVSSGLVAAALANVYEKKKVKQEAEAIIHHKDDQRRSRSRSGGSKNSRRRGTSFSSEDSHGVFVRNNKSEQARLAAEPETKLGSEKGDGPEPATERISWEPSPDGRAGLRTKEEFYVGGKNGTGVSASQSRSQLPTFDVDRQVSQVSSFISVARRAEAERHERAASSKRTQEDGDDGRGGHVMGSTASERRKVFHGNRDALSGSTPAFGRSPVERSTISSPATGSLDNKLSFVPAPSYYSSPFGSKAIDEAPASDTFKFPSPHANSGTLFGSGASPSSQGLFGSSSLSGKPSIDQPRPVNAPVSAADDAKDPFSRHTMPSESQSPAHLFGASTWQTQTSHTQSKLLWDNPYSTQRPGETSTDNVSKREPQRSVFGRNDSQPSVGNNKDTRNTPMAKDNHSTLVRKEPISFTFGSPATLSYPTKDRESDEDAKRLPNRPKSVTSASTTTPSANKGVDDDDGSVGTFVEDLLTKYTNISHEEITEAWRDENLQTSLPSRAVDSANKSFVDDDTISGKEDDGAHDIWDSQLREADSFATARSTMN